MSMAASSRSTRELMSDILGHVSRLIRNEADLARAEISESLDKLKASLAAMALALALGIVGLNVLAAALVVFLTEAGLATHWASLAVGLVLLVIAFAVYSFAKSALQRIGFMPTRSAENVSRDASAIKDTFNDT
ncbi:phage holin family protein [Rhodobacteraceae bacterium 2376]|uniref:Phage holin family protein n=1 Tax=Rhabdonatronobacter sediminivivens TaxID=2743469 RepID=A0A7Z0I2E3_9RHOB|nr:phage holin family protein [Rhabdonatronobacter sediminivivens]NYS26696.1 phage holin family protein [Rhabdonatronobacter sediminivivens]